MPPQIHSICFRLKSNPAIRIWSSTQRTQSLQQRRPSQAQYNAVVDGDQLAGILHNPSIPSGLVSVSGSAQYQSMLRAAPGSFESLGSERRSPASREPRAARTPALRAEISNIAAHYSLANGDATLQDFRASLLGGAMTAQGTMKNIGGESRSKFDATLHGISLASAKRMMGSAASTGPVAIAGTLNATATATWGKTFDDLIAHTDATIHAGVDSGQRSTLTAVQVASPSPTPSAPSPAGPVPVEGALHATYTGKTQQLALDHSYFRTPQTNLDLNGTISKSSSLAVQLRANDLHEVESIADLFRTSAPAQPMQPLGLAGTASFTGVVRGTTSAPHLTGQLTAQNLELQGSSWKLVRTNIDASSFKPEPATCRTRPPPVKGHLTFNASARSCASGLSPNQVPFSCSLTRRSSM